MEYRVRFYIDMARRLSSYRESLIDALADPAEAAAYLNVALEESRASFLKAVANVDEADSEPSSAPLGATKFGLGRN
jgi:DNA-binding phage protein